MNERSQGWEINDVTTAAIFPDGHVLAGANGATDYEISVGAGYITNLAISYFDASGTNELIVRVYDQVPYRGAHYAAADVNSRSGLYVPGGNTGIVTPQGGDAVVDDEHVVDRALGTAASRWREVVDAAVGTPAVTDPRILGSWRIGVNGIQSEITPRAHCLHGMVIEVIGVATGDTLAEVDHINVTATWIPRRRGSTRDAQHPMLNGLGTAPDFG